MHVYDREWTLLARQRVDFKLKRRNKGMEGLAHLYHRGELHLLMLCELNKCRSKRARGKGRIIVFKQEAGVWRRVDRIKLPKTLMFSDYSGLDLKEGRLAVTSQESGGLWVGALSLRYDSKGRPDWSVEAPGQVFDAPRRARGSAYCNLEGVSFSPDGLILVSDQRKSKQPEYCDEYDQSLHVVKLSQK